MTLANYTNGELDWDRGVLLWWEYGTIIKAKEQLAVINYMNGSQIEAGEYILLWQEYGTTRTIVIDYMNGEPDQGRGVSWWSFSSYTILNSESESESRQVINGKSLSWVELEEISTMEVADGDGPDFHVTGKHCEVEVILLGDGERSISWGINGVWLPFTFGFPLGGLDFLGAGDGDVGLPGRILHFRLWWLGDVLSTDSSKSLLLGGWQKVAPLIPSYYWYLSESNKIQKFDDMH